MRKTLIIVICAVIVISSAVYYLFYEDTTLQTWKTVVRDQDIPEEFNGYKIAHISDYHNAESKRLNNMLLRSLRDEKPDIIVITGDLIDSRRTDVDRAVKLIKDIKNIAPIYYVVGNHEARCEAYAELKSRMEAEGVRIFENQYDVIERNGAQINLAGIEDPSCHPEILVLEDVIIRDEIQLLDIDNGNYTVLLSHRAEAIDCYADNGVDLAFTGHAHGGQIRIPFIGGLIAPAQGFFPKYTDGLYTKGDTQMIVSRGIGNSLFPFRINNRPELVIATLSNH